jgi:hypothetical protein
VSGPSTEMIQLLDALRLNGVSGIKDFGRFANNTQYFEPSTFDERAAMPTLLEALPLLSDPRLVETVARHLGRKWAKPKAFWPLHDAFIRFGLHAPLTAWAIGDSLMAVSTQDHADALLALAVDPRYGMSRQMIVLGLYRFKANDRVESTLTHLLSDSDVSLHAISALQRVIGPEAMIPKLERIVESDADGSAVDNAAKRMRAIRKKLAAPN